MYHVEIRQFPHNVCRFNLSERELLPIAVPWAREEWVELGERKWNVNQAKLTIIEGPQLSMPQLAMGRGWRNAQRHGEEVTERVLETIRQAPAPGARAATPAPAAQAAAPLAPTGKAPAGQAGAGQAGAGQAGAGERAAGERTEAAASARPSSDTQLLADSLGLQILALLDEGTVSPQRVWRLAAERLSERPVAESLALGEQAIRSLLERGLIVLQAVAPRAAAGEDRGQEPEGLAGEPVEGALRAIESWAGDGQSAPLSIRRA